jgi:hypothetical protein
MRTSVTRATDVSDGWARENARRGTTLPPAVAHILELQRLAGNAAVTNLVSRCADVRRTTPVVSLQRTFMFEDLPPTFEPRLPEPARGHRGGGPVVQRDFYKEDLPASFLNANRSVSPRLGTGGWKYEWGAPVQVTVKGALWNVVHVSVPGQVVPRTRVDPADTSGFMTTEHVDFHVTLERVGAPGRLHYHFKEDGSSITTKGDDLTLLQGDEGAWAVVVATAAEFANEITSRKRGRVFLRQGVAI